MFSKEFMAAMKDYRSQQIKEVLAEEEALLADGFEEALIGHSQGRNVVAVYDYNKCIQVLMTRDEMTIEDALEFFEFNVTGAYVGEKTPVFVSLP